MTFIGACHGCGEQIVSSNVWCHKCRKRFYPGDRVHLYGETGTVLDEWIDGGRGIAIDFDGTGSTNLDQDQATELELMVKRRIHHLKTWPAFFQATVEGRKPYELRKDDRGFQEGDILFLHEWDPEKQRHTEATMEVRVTHVLRGPVFGLEGGWVVMGIREVSVANPTPRKPQPKRCGKCGSLITSPGPCPTCNDRPFG